MILEIDRYRFLRNFMVKYVGNHLKNYLRSVHEKFQPQWMIENCFINSYSFLSLSMINLNFESNLTSKGKF